MKDKDDLTGFFMVFSPWSSEILTSMDNGATKTAESFDV